MQSPMQIIQAFNQFKASFNGNAEEEVRKLLASGKISQKELNEVQTMARELQKLLNIR